MMCYKDRWWCCRNDCVNQNKCNRQLSDYDKAHIELLEIPVEYIDGDELNGCYVKGDYIKERGRHE